MFTIVYLRALMEKEITKVKECLQRTFKSASDIFIDPSSGECEVKVSVDEFEGEISRRLFSNGVKLSMVDYNDTYPFKYVFSYTMV